jgi:glycosyltransferase involved in cell wall biosynthesis
MKAFINSPASQWSPSDIAFHVLEYPLYHASNRFAIANSNHIITCSHTLLNELRSIYHDFDPRKSSVIYNGIDLEEIVDISTNSNLQRSNENFTLIFYGRLTWLKGIPYLLDAFELLTTEYPNLHLKIYGDGPLRKKIQTIVSKCGLQDRIYIGGKISRSKLLLEIMTADVVVLPSLREAQPISVLEAMACKKPLVVFDLPFASEYIHDSLNGLLAKPQNPNDLAIKIRELLSDKALRTKIGQNAYEYIKDHHNWGYLVNQYIEIYNKLIGISLLS